MKELWKKLLVVVAAVALAVAIATSGTKELSATATLVQGVPDSLIITATWTNPASDANGPVDSIRLGFLGIFTDSSITLKPPFPTTTTVRHTIPANAYPSGTGGSSTFDVFVTSVTFRRGVIGLAVTSNKVSITLTGPGPLNPPPPNISGLSITAVKKP